MRSRAIDEGTAHGQDSQRSGRTLRARHGRPTGHRPASQQRAGRHLVWLLLLLIAGAAPAAAQAGFQPDEPGRGSDILLAPHACDLGERLAYQLDVTREAGAADSICHVALELPTAFLAPAAIAVPSGWSATVVGTEIRWNADSLACLPPGASLGFGWMATAPDGVGEGGDYVLGWSVTNARGAREAGSSTLHVREPDLNATSLLPDDLNGAPLQRGDVARYTFTALNTGDMDAAGVTFRAQVPPAGTTYIPGSTRLNGAPVPDVGANSPLRGGLMVHSPGAASGTIAAGAVATAHALVRVSRSTPYGHELDLALHVEAASGHSGYSVHHGPRVERAPVSLAFDGPATAAACRPVAYELVLTGEGPGTAYDAYAQVFFPTDFVYLPGSTEIVSSLGPSATGDPHLAPGRLDFNHDGSAPNPGNDPLWDIPANETLTLRFALVPQTCSFGAYDARAQAWARDGEEGDYAEILPAGAQRVTLPEARLALAQTPTAPPAYVGDLISWTIALKATGAGDVTAIRLRDVLDPGLAFDPATTVPPPSTVEVAPDGRTTLTWDETIPALAWLPAGTTTEIVVGAELRACSSYNTQATAAWGCASDGPCQTATAAASVDLQLAAPRLTVAVTPDPIHVPACDPTGVPVSIAIANHGGPARDLVLTLTRPAGPLQIANVTGATYDPGPPERFTIGDVTDPVTVAFDLFHSDACHTPAGAILLTPEYTDDCGVRFTTPPVSGRVTTSALPGLALELDGEIEVPEGTAETYTLRLTHPGGPPPAPVTLEVEYPAPFSYNGDADLPPTNGFAPGAALSSWQLAPAVFAASGELEIHFSLTARSGECGTAGTLRARAETETPCGAHDCPRQAQATLPIANDCPTDASAFCDIGFERYVNGALASEVEPCAPIDYVNVITLADAPLSLTWSDLTFSADAAAGQRFLGFRDAEGNLIPGEVEIELANGAGKSCRFTLMPERDGEERLSLNFDLIEAEANIEACDPSVDWLLPRGLTVTLRYTMTAPAESGMFFDFGRLRIEDSWPLSCSGLIAEPVELRVRAAHMDVGVDVPDMVDACGAGAIASIVVTKRGSSASYDNVLYFSTEDFAYLDDPADPDYFAPRFENLPDVGLPVSIGDIGNGQPGVYWKLGDLPPDFSHGRVEFPVRKRCQDAATAVRLVYDDRCGDDDTDNVDENAHVAYQGGVRPRLVRRGDVTFELTPESVFADAQDVTWTLYLINGGPGAARNLEFHSSQTGSGIHFHGARVFDADGAPVASGFRFTPEAGGGASAAGWLAALPAGETYRVEIDAAVDGCGGLEHRVRGQWGCLGDVCQTGSQLQTESAVTYPTAALIATLASAPTLGPCGPQAIEIDLRNASLVRAYRPRLRLTPPPGLDYVRASTELAIAHEPGQSGPSIVDGSGRDADPDADAASWVWDLTAHLSEPYLAPGDVITIRCDLEADGSYRSGRLTLGGRFENACGEEEFITPQAPELTLASPAGDAFAASFDLDAVAVCTPNGSAHRLAFEIENGGRAVYGPAELELELPAGLRYEDDSCEVRYPAPGGGVHTAEPQRSGSGASADPVRLRWSLPSDLDWPGGETLSASLRVRHPGAIDCETFVDGAPLALFVRPRICPGGERELEIGPLTAPVDRRSGIPALTLHTADLTPNGPLAAGDELQVTLAIGNAGDARLRSVRLDLEFPDADLEYLTATPAPDQVQNGRLRWTGGAVRLDPGEEATVTATLRVANEVAAGEPLELVATYHDNCCAQSAVADELLSVGGGAGLELQFAATRARLLPGEPVTYELLVTNTGFQTVEDVVVDVTPDPGGMSFIDSDFDADRVVFTGTPAAPEWTIAPSGLDGGLPAGAAELIRLSYDTSSNENLLDPPPGDDAVELTARISSVRDASGLPLAGRTLLDEESERLMIGSRAAEIDVQVVPTTAVVTPGAEFSYHVTATNVGDVELHDVVLTVTPVPGGFTYIGWNGDEAIVETTDTPPTFTISSLPVGAAKLLALDFAVAENPAALDDPSTLLVTGGGVDPSGAPVAALDALAQSPVSVGGAALDVYKLADSPVVRPGRKIIYDVTVTNTGDVALHNIRVKDLLPPGVAFRGSQLSPGVYFHSDNPPKFDMPELAPGAARTFALTCKVSADTSLLSHPVVNRVRARGFDAAGNLVQAPTYRSRLPLRLPRASFDIEKLAADPAVVPGEPVTYFIHVTNNGQRRLRDVRITDLAPPQFTLLQAVHDPDIVQLSADPPEFAIDRLRTRATKTIGLVFATDADYAGYGPTIDNPVVGLAVDPAGTEFEAEPAVATLPVVAKGASFTLAKTNPEPVVTAGEPTTYLISVNNTGDQVLRDLELVDTPPAGLTLAAAQFGAAVTQLASDPPTFAISTLPVHGEETIALTFDVAIETGAVADPVVNAIAGSAQDEGDQLVTAEAQSSLPLEVPASGLTLFKAPTQGGIVPGGTVTYLLTVANTGAQALRDVTVRDTLPAGLSFAFAHPGPGVVQTGSDPVVFEIADLPAGGLAEIGLTCAVTPDVGALSDPIVNTAHVAGFDAAGEAVVADPSSATLPIRLPDRALDVEKVATGSRVIPGKTMTYLITVANTGDEELQQITVTDPLPAGLTLVQAESDGDVTQTGSDPLVFAIPSLAPGEATMISLLCDVSNDRMQVPDPVVNTVRAQGWAPGEALVEAEPDSAVLPRVVWGKALDVEKVSVESPFEAGGIGHYIITVTNTADFPLTDIHVRDLLDGTDPTLPPLRYVDAEPEGTESPGNEVHWDLPDLMPGEAHTIILTVTVPYLLNNQEADNNVWATAVTPDAVTVSDADACTTPCRAEDASIHLEKLANETRLVMGGQVSYHLLVSNDGGQPVRLITLRDTIPDGLSFVDADFDDQKWQLMATDPVVELRHTGVIEPTSSRAVTLFFNASRDYDEYNLATGDSTVVNYGWVQGQDPVRKPVTARDAAELKLLSPRPAIQIHYTHTTGEIVPGERTTYLVKIENTGAQVLDEVVIAIPDLAAQGLEFEAANFDAGAIAPDHGGGEHRWRLLAPLAQNGSEQVRVTYAVSNDISVIPDPVASTASVTAIDEEEEPLGDTASEEVPLSPLRGAVSIDNSATQGEVFPGDRVTYLLTVQAGPELDLYDLVVTAEDLAASGLTPFQTTFDETVFAQTGDFEWTALDTFPAGHQEEIRVTYQAASDVDSLPPTIEMTAHVVAFDVYGRYLEESDGEELPVLLPESHLLLEKVALASALVPGETLTYLLTATNNGNQTLSDVTVTDLLPEPLTTLASYFDSTRIAFDPDPEQPQWTFLEELEPGEAFSVRLVVTTDPDPSVYGETLTDIAEATARDEGDELLTARATDTLPVHTPDVAVDITKIPSQNVIIPGGTASYLLRIQNVGRVDLLTTRVTEEIPAGLSYQGSHFDAGEVTLVATGPDVVWEVDRLEPGRAVEIQVFFDIAADPNAIVNPVLNTATADAEAAGDQSATDLAAVTLPVQESNGALMITKRALTALVRPGETLRYQIEVTNTGDLPLSGVVVSDSLVTGLTYESSVYEPDAVEFTGTLPGDLSWTLVEDFAPGERQRIDLIVRAAAAYDSLPNPLCNTARAIGATPGDVLVSDEASECLPVQLASPRVTIQKFTTEPVCWPGEEILYTLQITNTGNRDIVKAYIREELPLGLSYVSSVYDPNVLSFGGNRTDPIWAVAQLPVGATETVTVRLQAEHDRRSLEDPVVNVASVEAWDEFGESFSDSDFEETPVADIEPALNLDLLATSGALVPGGRVTYLFSLTNTGDEDLYTATVSDTLPAGLTIFSTDYDPLHVVETRTTLPGPQFARRDDGREVITWTREVLPIAAVEQMRLTCRVTENTALLDSLVANTAYATAANLAGDPVGDSDGDALVVADAGSAVDLAKSAVQADVVPGDYVTYLLTVRNAGASDLNDLRVVDAIPAGLTFDQSSFDNTAVGFAGADADSAVWTIPALPVGGFHEIRATFLAASDLTGNLAADTLRNEAVVTAYDPSAARLRDMDTETLPIHPRRADIQLLKWSDATDGLATQGAEIAYHIQVVNTGAQDLAPVTVVDYMPAGLRYLEADQAPDSVVVADEETRVYWSLDMLHAVESWEVLVRARIDTMLVDGAVIENRATAVGVDERGDEVRSQDLSRVLAGLPDIQIAKTADRPVARPGEKVTYTITYRNSGTADGHSVVVMDELPAGVSFVTGSATGGAFYEPRFNAVTRTIDELEIDRGAIFTYQVVLDGDLAHGTRIPNVATVYADAVSPAESDTAWVRVDDKRADLLKGVDRSVAEVGDTLSYTLTYHNLSDDDYDWLRITDAVAAELDYLPGSAEPAGVYDPGSRRLIWDLTEGLAAGAIGSVSFQARVRPEAAVDGQVANEAQMTVATVSDTTAVPSNRVVTLVVEAVGVAVEKTVDQALAAPDDVLTYTLEVSNLGRAPLTAVVVSDPIPAELEFLYDPADWASEPNAPDYDALTHRVAWEIGVISPNESVTLEFQGRVRADVRSGTLVTNRATVQSRETQPVVSNAVATLVQYPDLEITKRANLSSAVVGQEVEYTLEIANLADGPTDSTWVVDLLPVGFGYVTGSTELTIDGDLVSTADPVNGSGEGFDAGTELTWALGRLGAYAELTLVYRAAVTGEAGPGKHTNYARACGVTPLGDEICTDPAVAAVEVTVPELTITKTTAERSVEIGDIVLYRIAVQSNSVAEVTALEIRDQLPVGFELLPGSSVLNGEPVADPLLYADGLSAGHADGPAGKPAGRNVLVWPIGTLAGEEELELTYVAVVGLNAGAGVARNVAEAVGLDAGGGAVLAGPAEARIFVLDDELPGRLRGRVIVDCDDDGRPDAPQGRTLRFSPGGTVVDERGDAVAGFGGEAQIPPYAGLEILVEDGRRVVTDENGEFFFYPLEYGDHAVYLDPRSLEPETAILGEDSQFFTVLEGGEARVEFRICPPPPKQGSLSLTKAVTPDEVMAIKRVLAPETYLIEGILFETGKAQLRPAAERVLAEAAQRLHEDASATASIEGHTDIRPIHTAEFPDNYALSQARAAVVRAALIERYDVAPERLAARGFGPDRPIAPNTNARNLSLNRRTEIILLPSLEELTPAALFDPAEVSFELAVAYEGSFPPGEGSLRAAALLDALPRGLEYLLGSTRVNGKRVADPELLLSELSADESGAVVGERILKWELGTLWPGDVVRIEYRAAITDVPGGATYEAVPAAGPPRTPEEVARRVAVVDSLLRDPAFRDHRHLWENRVWFEAQRPDGRTVVTEAAGADLELAFERTVRPVKIVVNDIFFDTGRATLRPEAFGILDPAAELIRSRPGAEVRIEGHADLRPIRTREFPSNQELSEARARAVRDYLVEVEKLSPERFRFRGFGARRPIADNETAAGRQKNRRVEIIISGDESSERSFRPVPPGRRPGTVRIELR